MSKCKLLVKLLTVLLINSILSKDPSPIIIPLNQFKNGEYSASFKFGSNNQDINLAVDLSSQISSIPGFNTDNNTRSFIKRFDHLFSNSFDNLTFPKTNKYFRGDFTGFVVSDSLTIVDNNSLKNTRFLLFNTENNTQLISDGIVGFGYVNDQDDKYSIVLQAYNQKLIRKPVFSLFLTDSNRDSKIILDDQFSNPKFQSIYRKINYCYFNKTDENSGNSWECQISTVKINKEELNINETKVIFESNIKDIHIPKILYDKLKPLIVGDSDCELDNKGRLRCECRNLKKFNDLSLVFSEKSYFDIKMNNIVEINQMGKFNCEFDIIFDETKDYIVLGSSGLRGNYITFDYLKKRIGFVEKIFLEEEVYANENDDQDVKVFYLLGLMIILSVLFIIIKFSPSIKAKVQIFQNRNLNSDKLLA